jgi:hypothetical protein
VLVALIAAAASPSTSARAADSWTSSSAWWAIYNVAFNKCLGYDGNWQAELQPCPLYAGDYAVTTSWWLSTRTSDGYYQLFSAYEYSGWRCLDVQPWGSNAGGRVQVNDCDGGDSQTWYTGFSLDNQSGGIENGLTHMSIDTLGGASADGTPIIQNWFRLSDINDPTRGAEQWQLRMLPAPPPPYPGPTNCRVSQPYPTPIVRC